MPEIKKIKKCTKEDAVNKFDKVETKVPVHISDLPVEMFQHIYKFVPDEDLEHCLDVNLQWYNNANADAIWKARCKKYRVQDEGEKTELAGGKFENLCRPGRIWFNFWFSPAYRWFTNTPTHYRLQSHKKFQNIFGGAQFLSNQEDRCENLVKLSHPGTIYKLKPELNVREYKFMGKKFSDSKLEFDHSFDSRLTNNLEDRFLFKTKNNKHQHYWIDYNNKKISPMFLTEGIVFKLTKNKMIVHIETDGIEFQIIFYDHDGSNKRTTDTLFVRYKFNNEILLGLRLKEGMELWEIEGCEIKNSFQNIHYFPFSYSVIHPFHDIFYLKGNLGEVKAFNVRTGETIWELHDDTISVKINRLKIVCNKYLLTITNGSHMNVRDLRDGKLLYRKDLPNHITINDNYVLFSDSKGDKILSYLH